MPSWHLFLTFLLLLCSSIKFVNSEHGKCLDIEEVYPKKYFRRGAQSLTVNVETSTRMTHLLASHIFLIFAKEVLGYTKVNITIREDYFQITDVMERLSDYAHQQVLIPPATINLEVWTSPDYDTFEKEFVKEVGSVGPPGRFGWFIPSKYDGPIRRFYTNRFFWDDAIQEVHWSFFIDERLASSFNLDSSELDMFVYKNSYHIEIENGTKQFICPNTYCTNESSMYTPTQCLGRNCAVLLAPEFSASNFLIDQVNEMKAYVKILWVGKNLKSTVRLLDEYFMHKGDQKSYIFFHWYPSDVVKDEKNYISVKFKNNEFYNFTNIVNGYKYEMHRLVKMVWSKMEQDANPLFLGVRHFKLREEDYSFLLDVVEQGKYNESEIACIWMRKNKKVWASWNTSTTAVIYIGGIFPKEKPFAFQGKGIIKGASAAMTFINSQNKLLKGYKLQLIITDGKCQPDAVMSGFLDFIVTKEYYDNLVGVLGPACSETIEPIAAVSKQYRVLTVSYAAEGVGFSDRSKYPYFFRTIGENQHYKHVYLSLFKAFGWKRVAALTEDGQKYTEYISLMSDDLEKNQISFIANKKFPRGRSTDDMKYYLEDLKSKRARIIIADVGDHDARMVICEASRLEMTAKQGYVWFLPVWLDPDWYNTTKHNEKEKINCTIEEMIEGANGYFSLTHAYYAANDSIMQENITVGKWRDNMSKTPSDYAGFAYDAVWTYALALSQLLQNDSEDMSDLHSPATTNKLVKYIENVDFHGVSGHIKFQGGPSRVSIVHILQWYNEVKYTVGYFYPNISLNTPEVYGGMLSLNGTSVKWFTKNGKIPEDGTLPPPSCAVEGLARAFNVECQTAVIILNVIIAGILLIGVIGVCLYMKRKYDMKVEKTKNYMRSLGLPFDMQNASDLDKWEMRRECIVLNRKLGEGAFGMVYGGEAELDTGWTAVAVKTLKVGSTTEDKLDFLSEAEVMKRYEHKNIVKLLGVCTKEEPVYTVMEFMLYGDLKTYLLARRHLVKAKDMDESEDVSPKRLTNAALDVARGLSYLAELKFVHRDIASRNCLVNNQRTVKIGDFGMTRAIFDNDYYKFTRRARLPVRWMAPESLALGVFTPSSDVWSFGVLLYEIITFGNFPFQGKTNPEVLNEVKAGQTLQIPKAAKPQLVGLMNSCWKRESKERPTASQIVEFLANNPRLLCPCLDVPILSVQMGDSDELEMPSKTLKASPSKSANGSTFQASSTIFEDRIDPDNIPLEMCCAREPLLGQGRGSSSNLLTRLGVGSKRESEENDEYTEQNIPNAQDNTNV